MQFYGSSREKMWVEQTVRTEKTGKLRNKDSLVVTGAEEL